MRRADAPTRCSVSWRGRSARRRRPAPTVSCTWRKAPVCAGTLGRRPKAAFDGHQAAPRGCHAVTPWAHVRFCAGPSYRRQRSHAAPRNLRLQEPVMHPHVSICALAVGCAIQLAACSGDNAAAFAVQSPHPLRSAAAAANAERAGATIAQQTARRYVSREQLAQEELLAAPYTLVIDADDEAALASGLQLAETVHTFAGSKTQLGIFVRSRDTALAERLADRLTLEQGWQHVFVVQ